MLMEKNIHGTKARYLLMPISGSYRKTFTQQTVTIGYQCDVTAVVLSVGQTQVGQTQTQTQNTKLAKCPPKFSSLERKFSTKGICGKLYQSGTEYHQLHRGNLGIFLSPS